MNKPFLVCLSILLAAGFCLGQVRSPQTDHVETFMREKLKHAQRVLEGLTTEDFDLIAKNAQSMGLLSEATVWQVLQTPEYARRSAEFRHSANKLKVAAQKKNLDGATLAYVDLTMKCVECHKYVRNVRSARLDVRDSPSYASAQIRNHMP